MMAICQAGRFVQNEPSKRMQPTIKNTVLGMQKQKA